MRSNSIEKKSDKDNNFNEDDDNLIFGSMNPEYTRFSSDPETCYYIFFFCLVGLIYPQRISMTHISN